MDNVEKCVCITTKSSLSTAVMDPEKRKKGTENWVKGVGAVGLCLQGNNWFILPIFREKVSKFAK